MSNVYLSATIIAYEAKDGTFSAACSEVGKGEVKRQSGFDSLEEAKYAAQMMAWDIAPCTYAPMKRKGEYCANAWAEVN